jgi:SAM-dependent methyltransferase
LILGRDPENDTLVESHMRARDLESLRRAFIESPEFRSAARNPPRTFSAFTGGVAAGAGSIDWAAPIRVDLKADKETMRRLLQRVERCWTQQGQTEPFWSVCSHEQYKRQNFAPNAEAFYASGEQDAMRLAVWLDRNGVDPSKFETCLELGCGAGRVTPWLARRFHRVLACDISLPHIGLTTAHVGKQGLRNVEFVHTPRIQVFDTLPAVDVVFSIIVLQHNPPPIIYALLARVFRRLRPGGVALFQVPTYAQGYQFDIEAYLSAPEDRRIEMHLIPQRSVFELADSENCSVLEVEPDLCVGNPNWLSNTFLVMKRRSWAFRRASQLVGWARSTWSRSSPQS